jgi:hypothetical protein
MQEPTSPPCAAPNPDHEPEQSECVLYAPDDNPLDDGMPSNSWAMGDSLNQWYSEERSQHPGLHALRGELSQPNPDRTRLSQLYQESAPTLQPRDGVIWRHVGNAIHENRFNEASQLVRRLQGNSTEEQ